MSKIAEQKQGDTSTSTTYEVVTSNWCIVRCRKAASFIGKVAYVKGSEVHLTQARRLWGVQINKKEVTDSAELAMYGAVPEASKISATTDVLFVFDACNIMVVTDEIAMTMVNAPVYYLKG